MIVPPPRSIVNGKCKQAEGATAATRHGHQLRLTPCSSGSFVSFLSVMSVALPPWLPVERQPAKLFVFLVFFRSGGPSRRNN